MADNLKKQPKKGILKNSSSFETEEQQYQRELRKGTKWDEMNIIATHHPKDKDYGHMKIEEPKTPYNYNKEDSGDEADGIDADLLAKKITLEGSEVPKAMHESEEESSDDEIEETPEERAKRKAFEMKRKHHYNEFAAVKLARKLMEQDEEEDEEDRNPDNGLREDKIIEEPDSEEEKEKQLTVPSSDQTKSENL